MMDQDFVMIVRRMADEQGKEILVNGRWRSYLGDYLANRYQKERDILERILKANCGEFINSASDVLERKGELLVKLEEDYALSPRAAAEYLDLLGLILKGDTTRCGGTAPPPPSKPAPPKRRPANKPLLLISDKFTL